MLFLILKCVDYSLFLFSKREKKNAGEKEKRMAVAYGNRLCDGKRS